MAAVFDQNSGVEISTVVADVAEKLGIGKGDKAEETIKARLMPFVQAVLPGRVVKAEFAGKETLKLGPGGRNGISSDLKAVPQFEGGSVVSTMAQVPQGANGILEGKTFFAEPEGWGIISGREERIHIHENWLIGIQILMILSRSLRQVIPSVSYAQHLSLKLLLFKACRNSTPTSKRSSQTLLHFSISPPLPITFISSLANSVRNSTHKAL